VFGPVLHVLRYRRESLDEVVASINALGYGLTLGIHSRVDQKIESIVSRARVGNVYVNRNIVGAVVGVQPFGGEGLSGTGPKAGGPLYLYRLLQTYPPGAAVRELDEINDAQPASGTREALEALCRWPEAPPALRSVCGQLRELVPNEAPVLLPGPTGERNTYSLLGRETVLCLARAEADLLQQLALVFAAGGRALWPREERAVALRARLPRQAQACMELVDDWNAARFDAVLHHGEPAERADVARRLAQRGGPIAALHAFAPGEAPLVLERLLVERVVSVNTAAAGGNASLMTVG
jgi:RHH-type proline utilization regulon transcriptional repressor/proline dehydrogenase/delta 1-pyrroline-5-carboxylate dehydrogenase